MVEKNLTFNSEILFPISPIQIESYLKSKNVCLHTLIYIHTALTLVLAYNLNVK